MLVLPKGGAKYDLQIIFLNIVHRFYCENLVPIVEEGTDAFTAVQIRMTEDQTMKRLLASVMVLYVYLACMSCMYVLHVCFARVFC